MICHGSCPFRDWNTIDRYTFEPGEPLLEGTGKTVCLLKTYSTGTQDLQGSPKAAKVREQRFHSA